MISRTNLSKIFICPTCYKGKVLADEKSRGVISCQCPRCKHFFLIELQTSEIVKGEAAKNKGY